MGFLCLAFCQHANAAAAFVQTKPDLGFSGSSVALAYTTNNTKGNLLIAYIEFFGGGATLTSITDSQGNSWNPVFSLPTNNFGQPVYLYYAYNAKAGANTVTANLSGSATSGGFYIYEYSGIVSSEDPLDVQSSNSFASATSINTSATSKYFGELLFSPFSSSDNRSGTVTTTGYTVRTSQTYDFAADNIGTNPPQSNTVTWTVSSADPIVVGLAAFKVAYQTTPVPAGRRKAVF